MANLDDDPPAGGPDGDGIGETLEQRVARLERENERLRLELADLKQLRAADQLELRAHRTRGLPAGKAEWDRMVAEGVAGDQFIRDVVAGLEWQG